ncbi:exo-alpha-sialidase, partial [candidate division TA06 bacterium]|nr:exo-alpha-sialidase [candidate division TA06 bacterium]
SSWTYTQFATGAPAPFLLDKNHLVSDNSTSSSFQGNLYSAWTKFPANSPSDTIEFIHSTDQGATWVNRQRISGGSGGIFHHGVNLQTSPNGEVYATWAVYTAFTSGDLDEDRIGFNSSTDGGVTWPTATVAIDSIAGIRTGSFGPYGIRVNSFPSMAVDNSNGPFRGRIYIVWTNTGVPGINTGDPDIYLIRSDDQGASWSSPIRVNDDPVGNGANQWFPWISCDPLTGCISVVWYDGRNDIGGDMAEVFVGFSGDGGNTFDNFAVSDNAFTVGPLPGFSGNYNGDYIGIASRGGNIYPTWNSQVPGTNSQGWISPLSPQGVNFLQDEVFNLYEPPDPWVQEGLVIDLIQVVAGVDLFNLHFFADALQCTNVPCEPSDVKKIHDDLIEFIPEEIAFVPAGETIFVEIKKSIPIGQHACTYFGKVHAIAETFNECFPKVSDDLDLVLQVLPAVDMDVDDNHGNVSDNVMTLQGAPGDFVSGTFTIVNPNSQVTNVDMPDGPGNLRIDPDF